MGHHQPEDEMTPQPPSRRSAPPVSAASKILVMLGLARADASSPPASKPPAKPVASRAPAASGMRAAASPAAAAKIPANPSRPAAAVARMPDIILDEAGADLRHSHLVHFVLTETVVIAILTGILLIGTPFFRPVYLYYARNPQSQVAALVPLTLPNMTNRAVLSWATNSITEIMTLGFGDFQTRLNAQRPRFTQEGWESFTKAFVRQKIGQTFRDQQMVLTTVASGTPVIVAQGVNDKRIYEWHVQMPVIMTYATNNNVTQRAPSIIELTIVRVPAEQSPSGIGIAAWTIKN